MYTKDPAVAPAVASAPYTISIAPTQKEREPQS